DEQAEVIRRFATSDVEGVVLPPPLSESQPILVELEAMHIPVVTVAMGSPRESGLNVRIDDYAAAMEMTRYLLDLGHRDIGFIKGHPNIIASHDRFRGFCDALTEAGLDCDAAAPARRTVLPSACSATPWSSANRRARRPARARPGRARAPRRARSCAQGRASVTANKTARVQRGECEWSKRARSARTWD